MALYRVWLHDGTSKTGTDVQAESSREAAEKVHGSHLDAFGPLSALRATVISNAGPSPRTDGFYLPRSPAVFRA